MKEPNLPWQIRPLPIERYTVLLRHQGPAYPHPLPVNRVPPGLFNNSFEALAAEGAAGVPVLRLGRVGGLVELCVEVGFSARLNLFPGLFLNLGPVFMRLNQFHHCLAPSLIAFLYAPVCARHYSG